MPRIRFEVLPTFSKNEGEKEEKEKGPRESQLKTPNQDSIISGKNHT